jgi:elongation factor P hydroxylase
VRAAGAGAAAESVEVAEEASEAVASEAVGHAAEVVVSTLEGVASEVVVLEEIIKIVLKYIKQKRAFRKRFFLILK